MSLFTVAPSSLFHFGKILIYVNADYHKLRMSVILEKKIVFSSLETSVSFLVLAGYCLLLERKLSINVIEKNSDVPSQAVLKHNYFSVK